MRNSKQPEGKIGKKREARILVMDDEELLRKLSVKVLSRLGYKVVTAADGREAIALYANASKSDKPFDLIIMDLTVPGGMGGKETIRRLRELDPDVKAIISSGYSDDPVMVNCKKYGFQAVVAKPFAVRDLNKVLNELLV